MKISILSGFLEEQSANFPGKEPFQELIFITSSLAFLAASLAFFVSNIFSTITFNTAG